MNKKLKKQLKKMDKAWARWALEDECGGFISPTDRYAVYNMMLAAEIRAVPNDTLKNLGLSVCKSPNGLSIRPVESEGDTEVCISLEDGVLNIRVYNFGHDDYSAALIVPASTR